MNDNLKKIEKIKKNRDGLSYILLQNNLEICDWYENLGITFCANLAFILFSWLIFYLNIPSTLISFITNPVNAFSVFGGEKILAILLANLFELMLLSISVKLDKDSVKVLKNIKELKKSKKDLECKLKDLEFNLNRIKQDNKVETNVNEKKTYEIIMNNELKNSQVDKLKEYRNSLMELKDTDIINQDKQKNKIKSLKQQN